MTPSERKKLFDALIDGDISDADFLRLEAELSVDANVRQEFYKRMQLDLLLEREAKSQDQTDPSGVPAFSTGKHLDSIVGSGPSKTRKRIKWLALVGMALAATLAGIVIWLPIEPIHFGPVIRHLPTIIRPGIQQAEPTAAGFGILAGHSDAVWNEQTISTGELIPGGKLHLKSGLAHLELFSGVQIVIEGEAEFSIDSAMEVTIDQGRASANVPESAHGFQIKTKQGNVIDLGTEFAIDVDSTGSRVEVVSGEVELQPHGSKPERLLQGELRELSDGVVKAHELVESLGVVSPELFVKNGSTRRSDRIKSWLDFGKQLQKSKDVIAFYRADSEQPSSRRIENLANHSSTRASEGAVVACERTKDRWGIADGALDFSRVGSRVRVDVPGEFGSITLTCWVKINSLDKEYNSLFLTDGHELSEPHWQIMKDGRLFFSVKKYLAEDDRPFLEDGVTRVFPKHDFYSPSFWNSSLSGTWMMITTVYDIDDKLVTHYINGKSIGSESIPDKLLVDKVKIGPASIGNWSEPMYRTDPEFIVRNLNGSLDEFTLFSKALSSQEIAEQYQIGKPN